MKRNRRSVTIQDVARSAGVSVSTVSRVLNNKDDVAEDTYAKVQDVIDELGYASSLAARGMRSHHTNVIGLVIPDVSTTYTHEIMRGVNRAIKDLEYDLIIYTNGNAWSYASAEREVRYVTVLNGSIADGTIVVTPVAHNFPTHAPLVIIDPNHESPEIPSVLATNREGALDAMRYLIGLGHRRIGFITGRTDLVSGNQRMLGYLDGLAEAGIPYDPSLVCPGDYTIDKALPCACKLLTLPEPPTAIFAANDMSAMGVYQIAREMGIRIPDQLSVVGFDNVQEAAHSDPPLTTIDQNIVTLGDEATQMLMHLIRGEPLESHLRILPTRLVIRDSCRSVC